MTVSCITLVKGSFTNCTSGGDAKIEVKSPMKEVRADNVSAQRCS